MYLYLYFFVKKMGGKKLLINISLKPQGTNGRLYIDFGLHPNFWKFLRCCAALFLRAETDIRELLFASNSFKNILFLFLLPLFLLRSSFVFLSEDLGCLFTPERPQITPDHTRSSQNHELGTDIFSLLGLTKQFSSL